MDKALDALKYALKIAEAEEWNLGEGKIPEGKQQHVGLIAVLKMRAAIAELEGRRPEALAPKWYRPEDKMPAHCEYVLGVCAGKVYRCWFNEGTKKWRADPHVTEEWDIKLWTPMPKAPVSPLLEKNP